MTHFHTFPVCTRRPKNRQGFVSDSLLSNCLSCALWKLDVWTDWVWKDWVLDKKGYREKLFLATCGNVATTNPERGVQTNRRPNGRNKHKNEWDLGHTTTCKVTEYHMRILYIFDIPCLEPKTNQSTSSPSPSPSPAPLAVAEVLTPNWGPQWSTGRESTCLRAVLDRDA